MGYVKQLYMNELHNLKDLVVKTLALRKALKASDTDQEKMDAIANTINIFATRRFIRHINLGEKLKPIRKFVEKNLKQEQQKFSDKELEGLLKSIRPKNQPKA
jgi:L-lysine 2,3-aminomutase